MSNDRIALSAALPQNLGTSQPTNKQGIGIARQCEETRALVALGHPLLSEHVRAHRDFVEAT